MPVLSSYDYALLRVMPSVERGECVNVGVILFCRTRQFLEALIALDERRVLALDPDLDLEVLREHLETISLICEGKEEGGPIARLTLSERFHWLVAPRSAIIQTSVVHSGLCSDPATALQHLVNTMVKPHSAKTARA
ncbi:DUF3037 domain-containing protein [Ktedonospora formicarum]|uniref:DUF3037 domain-containing protein n=1 Tax=Ktedonospora formicarum TaxID=2778364 RepID=A0A8J3HV45_9CHLR|nr:DUF3037 domain-containing protein [Ktedonospora formicarum]GHO44324.1 hypothetical protein KSX_24870 [Ktedonospora formicarum]